MLRDGLLNNEIFGPVGFPLLLGDLLPGDLRIVAWQCGMNTLRKMVVLGLVGFFFCTIAWMICLDYYFYAYSPRSPDPANGFVYEAKIHHGATVYLTETQWRWFSPTATNVAFSVGLLALVTGVALSRRWKIW